MTLRSTVLFVLLVACGRDAATARAAPAPGKKPCAYLARADAEAALELKLPLTNENLTVGECDYSSPEFYGSQLTVGSWEGVTQAFNGLDAQHRPLAVAGVGDEALHIDGHLWVRKGGRGFMINLNGPAVDGLKDRGLARATLLAKKILTTF